MEGYMTKPKSKPSDIEDGFLNPQKRASSQFLLPTPSYNHANTPGFRYAGGNSPVANAAQPNSNLYPSRNFSDNFSNLTPGIQNSAKFTSQSFFKQNTPSITGASPLISSPMNNSYVRNLNPHENYAANFDAASERSCDRRFQTISSITPQPQNANSSAVSADSLSRSAATSDKTDPCGESDAVPKIQNIVSTADFGCKLDLRTIALQAKNAEYNPKRFAAVIMRIKEPKTTALIFHSGRMVCTGAKSEEESKIASRKYAKTIKSFGFPVVFKDFKIENIVGSCDVKFNICLSSLNMKLDQINISSGSDGNDGRKKLCSYIPEIFPGLIYHMLEPEIVLLIFASGKLVLTGAKKREEINNAYRKIYDTLKAYRMHFKDGKSTGAAGNNSAPACVPGTH